MQIAVKTLLASIVQILLKKSIVSALYIISVRRSSCDKTTANNRIVSILLGMSFVIQVALCKRRREMFSFIAILTRIRLALTSVCDTSINDCTKSIMEDEVGVFGEDGDDILLFLVEYLLLSEESKFG